MQTKNKEVVRDIQSFLQLEQELQLSQAQHGVTVLDIYNAEWGHCNALGETFRRLYTDAGDTVHIRFFSVEVNAVLESLKNPETHRNPKRPHNLDLCAETLPSFWTSILEARRNHSKPYIVFYKDGVMRGHVEGIDTPKICSMVRDLCKSPIPAREYIINDELLKFWEARFSSQVSEVRLPVFVRAVLASCDLKEDLPPNDLERIASAVGAADGTVTAAGLQKWIGEDATLASTVQELLPHLFAGPSSKGSDSTHFSAVEERSPTSVDNSTEKVDETLNHVAVTPEVASPLDGDGSPITGDDASPLEGHGSSNTGAAAPEYSYPIEEGQNYHAGGELSVDTAPTVEQMNDNDSVLHVVDVPDDATAGEMEPVIDVQGSDHERESEVHGGEKENVVASANTTNQIFINRWVTVSDEEMRVWNSVAALPLHYPSESVVLQQSCTEAENEATAALSTHANGLQTLSAYLQECGVAMPDIHMLCLSADQKIGSETLSYGKLALILMLSDAEANRCLTGSTEDYTESLRCGSLISVNPSLAFTALCLCASEAYPDEAFLYYPPVDHADELAALKLNDEVALHCLTPLLSGNMKEGVYCARVVGLPKVIELATTDADVDTMVLSHWFAKMMVTEKTDSYVTLQFVEGIADAAFQDFVASYTERLMEDEGMLDKREGSDSSKQAEEPSDPAAEL